MSSSQITVDYVELGDEFGLRGGIDSDGNQFEIKPFLVAWSDRSAFMQQAIGRTVLSGGIGGSIYRFVPYALPDNPRLYADSIEFKPEGRLLYPTSPIAYSHAIITVTFRQPKYNFQPADDPGNLNSLSQDPDEAAALLWATQELDIAREYMTLPSSSVKFKSDGKVPKTSQSRSVLVMTMRITFHKIPFLPFSLFKGYADTLNDATFLGCAKGTVMFEGPQTVREINGDGSFSQRLQLVFKWRQYDWNARLRDDALAFDLLVDNAYTGGANGNSDAFCDLKYKNFKKLLQLLPA